MAQLLREGTKEDQENKISFNEPRQTSSSADIPSSKGEEEGGDTPKGISPPSPSDPTILPTEIINVPGDQAQKKEISPLKRVYNIIWQQRSQKDSQQILTQTKEKQNYGETNQPPKQTILSPPTKQRPQTLKKINEQPRIEVHFPKIIKIIYDLEPHENPYDKNFWYFDESKWNYSSSLVNDPAKSEDPSPDAPFIDNKNFEKLVHKPHPFNFFSFIYFTLLYHTEDDDVPYTWWVKHFLLKTLFRIVMHYGVKKVPANIPLMPSSIRSIYRLFMQDLKILMRSDSDLFNDPQPITMLALSHFGYEEKDFNLLKPDWLDSITDQSTPDVITKGIELFRNNQAPDNVHMAHEAPIKTPDNVHMAQKAPIKPPDNVPGDHAPEAPIKPPDNVHMAQEAPIKPPDNVPKAQEAPIKPPEIPTAEKTKQPTNKSEPVSSFSLTIPEGGATLVPFEKVAPPSTLSPMAQFNPVENTPSPMAQLTPVSENQNTNVKPYDLWQASIEESSPHALFRHAFRMTECPENQHLFSEPEKFLQILLDLDPPHPKKYAFQIEKGPETGKLHFQGFISLNKKKRAKQIGQSLNSQAYGIQFFPAYDENALIKYSTKADTRVQGPWIFPSNLYGRGSKRGR